jgi:hypothetical protein
MAHNYNGVNAPGAPTIPTSPTAGKGVWPAAQLVDDGDDRDAGGAMAGIEAGHDKANFLAWRMLNIIEGGTYTYTALLTIRNDVDWNGEHTFNNGVLIDTASVFLCNRPAGFTNTVNIGLTGGPGCTINSPATLNDLIDATQTGPFVKSGNAAVTKGRKKTLPAGGGGFTASEADFWEVPVLAAGRTWTPAVESGEFTYTVQQADPTSQAFDGTVLITGHNVTFKAAPAAGAGFGTATIRHRTGGTHRVVSFFDAAGVTGNGFGALVTM